MMKILITGASGFIGRNLKEALIHTYDISAPTSHELDLLDHKAVEEFLSENSFDLIIHAATWNATRNSPKDTSKVLDHNLRMFFNLVRCKRLFGRMIYYGSGAEYSRPHWKPKMREDYFDTHVPSDQYGFSKYIMTKYAIAQENIINLRLFAVFGKYEDWEIRFISNAICKAIWDLPITIKQNVLFDYIYIDDLIEITKWFINNEPKHNVYNICSGTPHALLSLAKKIILVSGKPTLKIIVRKGGMGCEYSGDPSRFLEEVGGFSFKPVAQAIQELYCWYESHKEQIPPSLLIHDK